MKKVRKVLALLLALAMCVGLMAVVASADGEIASGEVNTYLWSIDAEGKLTIEPGQTTTSDKRLHFWSISDAPWYEYRDQITSAVVKNTVYGGAYTRGMFHGLSNATTIDVSGLDTTNCVNLDNMFSHCVNLTEIIGLENFDTQNVESMDSLFSLCENLTYDTLKAVEDWDTSSVEDMTGMFYACTSLTEFDFSKLETGNVEDMQDFLDGTGFETIDVSGLDIGKVGDIDHFFANCRNLKTITGLENFNTSNVYSMVRVFAQDTKLESVEGIEDWDVSKVKDFGIMFEDCSSLTSIDISKWDTSSAQFAGAMFSGCSGLQVLKVGPNFMAGVSEREHP
ncbi:MAG: BspA family leucine-rich repeat surface protein, partial [Oscillospiraceae bacterium]|nr:BspA family leucine-rich repeat surface protein [Oscillospiraceae bacterium]